jgi:hypothetical protein
MTFPRLSRGLAWSTLLLVAWACGGKAIVDAGGGGGSTASSGSSSGTSSSSSSTGSSGTGGAPQCSTVNDCPSIEPGCEAPVCIGGQCGLVSQPGGTLCGISDSGICDGAGTCIEVCPELCDDITYCINPPDDEQCVSNCEATIFVCSDSEIMDLHECHQAFAFDCDNLIELMDCLVAVPCYEFWD